MRPCLAWLYSHQNMQTRAVFSPLIVIDSLSCILGDDHHHHHYHQASPTKMLSNDEGTRAKEELDVQYCTTKVGENDRKKEKESACVEQAEHMST